MASHLTWILAEYPDTLAWLMRSILEHDTKILCDKDTQLLLTLKFWILPLYRELLNSARRNGPVHPRKEHGVARVWSRSFARRSKSRKGKRKCSVLVHSCFRNVGLHIYEWATFWIKFGLLRYLIVFQMLFLLFAKHQGADSHMTTLSF